MKMEGSDPHPDPDLNPDPLVRGMDPRIRIRLHTKMSWIRNTGQSSDARADREHTSLQERSGPYLLVTWWELSKSPWRHVVDTSAEVVVGSWHALSRSRRPCHNSVAFRRCLDCRIFYILYVPVAYIM
jgi:hypothetical protein